MKLPQFEDPINNVKDIVDNNITVFTKLGAFFETMLLFETESEWQDNILNAGNKFVVAMNCDNPSVEICLQNNESYYYYIHQYVHADRTHAFVKEYLDHEDLKIVPEKKKWWRSEKVFADGRTPYRGLITSRDWILNEVNIMFP